MKNENLFPLKLSPRAYTELVSHCQSALPNEACGLLISSKHDQTFIDTILPIKNVHPNPRHSFTFDPTDWITALYQLDRSRLQLAGYYHSHPSSAPVPSMSDSTGLLSQSRAITLILSFSTGDPIIRAYRKPSDKWLPVDLFEQTDKEEAD
jgi:[CysO sulfur-carrier protein]-S-L-cysteine hydrolase